MQITGINRIQAGNVRFGGIWGDIRKYNLDDTFNAKDKDIPMGKLYRKTVKDYYPFMDETEEEIKKIKKENSYFKHYPPTFAPESKDMRERTYECIVNVIKRIPLTAKTYLDYVSGSLKTKEKLSVENKLKLAGLQIFIKG